MTGCKKYFNKGNNLFTQEIYHHQTDAKICCFCFTGHSIVLCFLQKRILLRKLHGNNKPPVAHAGKNTTIILPVDSVILDGRASTDDKKIVSYQWKKISGPDTFKVQAGTCAIVLADIFGNNTTFTDNSISSLGFTLRIFTKFSYCANQIAFRVFMVEYTCVLLILLAYAREISLACMRAHLGLRDIRKTKIVRLLIRIDVCKCINLFFNNTSLNPVTYLDCNLPSGECIILIGIGLYTVGLLDYTQLYGN